MASYKISYINKEGRRKEFHKAFKLKKNKDYYISKKLSEGATNLKCEKVRVRSRINYNLEKSIVSKKKKIVSCGCVYALIHKDEVVYIGQSTHIMGRLNQHIQSSKVFDHYAVVEWVDAGQSYLDKRESEYIKALRPKYNTVGN